DARAVRRTRQTIPQRAILPGRRKRSNPQAAPLRLRANTQYMAHHTCACTVRIRQPGAVHPAKPRHIHGELLQHDASRNSPMPRGALALTEVVASKVLEQDFRAEV